MSGSRTDRSITSISSTPKRLPIATTRSHRLACVCPLITAKLGCGERRIDIEERYPDLAGSFHDFRTCDELCREHAAHDDGRENTHKALEP